MSSRFKTATHTSTNGAVKSLHDIINSVNDRFASVILIRAGGSNTQPLTWADSDGGKGGHLNPDDAVTMDFPTSYIDIDKIKVTVTTSDSVEVTVAG